MRIKTVKITNFRTLEDASIPFDDITTFIGPNGAGKSTILRALDWFFNGTKKTTLSDEDCSFGRTHEPITVRVTFDQLTEKDREALGKYTPPTVSTFTAWKTRTPDGTETLSANTKGNPLFASIFAAPTATQKKELYATLREDNPDLGLPKAGTGPKVEEALREWQSNHLDSLIDVPEVETNLFGFNSNAKLSGIFDFVLVTADLRATEEAIDSKSTIIGRILERTIDRTIADKKIQEIVEESQRRQREVFHDSFGMQLEGINKDLNAIVSSYTKGRTVTVEPAETDSRLPQTTFSVSIHDGDNATSVDRQGHGFQRTLLISALQMLATADAVQNEGTICLAIEEPELYQHPTQSYTFAKVLRSLASDNQRNIQVTYATHSPNFVESRHFDQVRRLVRNADKTPCVSINFATQEEVVSAIAPFMSEEQVRKQLDNTIANKLSDALFADRAILVEGTTEVEVLYGIGDRIGIGACEAAGISIVSIGGKTQFILPHAILQALGIPTSVLFDGDEDIEIRLKTKHPDRNEKSLRDERNNHAQQNKKLLSYLGRKPIDFPKQGIADGIAVFRDCLETFLNEEWPEWKVAVDDLVEISDIDLSKNSDSYRSATHNARGQIPALLSDLIALN